MQVNGSTTAAEDTLQTFQEVQLEAADDEDEDGPEAATAAAAVVAPSSSSSATLDVPEASLDNGGGGGSERGERVKGEISMLSSPLQVRTRGKCSSCHHKVELLSDLLKDQPIVGVHRKVGDLKWGSCFCHLILQQNATSYCFRI